MNDQDRFGLIIGAAYLNDQANQRAAQLQHTTMIAAFVAQGMTAEQASVAVARARAEANRNVNPGLNPILFGVGVVVLYGIAEVLTTKAPNGPGSPSTSILGQYGFLAWVVAVLLSFVMFLRMREWITWRARHRQTRHISCTRCRTVQMRRLTDPVQWNCYGCGQTMAWPRSQNELMSITKR